MALVLMGGVAGVIPAQAAQYKEEEITEKILYIKDLFGIGDEYVNFTQSVWDNSDGGAVWGFDWSTANYEKSIYVNLDEDSHITNYSYYTNETAELQIPGKMSEYYEKTAETFVKKVCPDIAGHISLDGVRYDYYGNNYVFTYVRVENGYPVPDNTISVTVNHVKDYVTSFYTNWDYKVGFSKPEKIIGKDEAASKLNNKLEMELQYISKWEDNKEEAFLAYVPSQDYYSVNAESGKVYTEKQYWNNGAREVKYEETAAVMDVEGGNGAKESVSLSEAEIEKVKEITSLISKEEAIAVVTSNKDLLIDKNVKQTNAYLSSAGDEYFWEITMSDPRPVDYSSDDFYRAYVSATVNAKDGKLTRFWSDIREYYDYSDVQNIEFKYSKNECTKKFEKFVKEIEPEKFAQTKKSSNEGGYVICYDYNDGEPIYGGRSLTYSRQVNEIPYYYNQISGAVDRVTGKIYSYSINWTDDIEFPSAENVITEKEAFDKYLSSDEFVLKYEMTSTTTMDEETYVSTTKTDTRLCYVTEIVAPYVDANTGKFITYNGEEYKPVSKNKDFTDISGHKYEKEIRFVSQLMYGISGDKFDPDGYVTNKFIKEVFNNMWYFNRTPQNIEDNDKKVTRQKVAGIITEALGYKKLAELDIFNVNYSDADKVSKKYKGAVAICEGLGLFNVKKGGKFKPSSKMKRGEFAYVVAKALIAGQNVY